MATAVALGKTGARCGRSPDPALFELVEKDGAEEDETSGDVLVERRNVEQVHGVLDRAHDEDADDGAGHGADAACEGDAAEHAGGDDLEGKALGGYGLAAGHA